MITKVVTYGSRSIREVEKKISIERSEVESRWADRYKVREVQRVSNRLTNQQIRTTRH